MKEWLAVFMLPAICLTGCEDSGYQDYSEAPLSEGHDHGHEHHHEGHEGKHGGHVLEMDDAHGHHAEMVFDKATRDITLYFYGSEIGVPKAATGLAVEIEKDGKEVVLESKAAPLEGETDETASRFVIAGSQLPETVTSEEQLDGHFHVTIDGREFVGDFHAHSHDEHHDHDDHAHDDEAHQEHDGDHMHEEHMHEEHKHEEHKHEESAASGHKETEH